MTDKILLGMMIVGMCIPLVGAIFLAYHKIPGWGWFLFLAFIIATGIKI